MFYEIAKLFAENYKKRLNSIRNLLSPTSSAQNTPLFVLRKLMRKLKQLKKKLRNHKIVYLELTDCDFVLRRMAERAHRCIQTYGKF